MGVTLGKFAGGTELGWEQLMHRKAVLPFTGTFKHCRNGLTGTSQSSARRNEKFCTWSGITPCTSTGWDGSAGRALGSGVGSELSRSQRSHLFQIS